MNLNPDVISSSEEAPAKPSPPLDSGSPSTTPAEISPLSSCEASAILPPAGSCGRMLQALSQPNRIPSDVFWRGFVGMMSRSCRLHWRKVTHEPTAGNSATIKLSLKNGEGLTASRAFSLNMTERVSHGPVLASFAVPLEMARNPVCTIPSLGECSMPNTLAFPSAVFESSLSAILDRNGGSLLRFYLSGTACQGILRRAENRGKQIPTILKQALERQSSFSAVESSEEELELMEGLANEEMNED